MTELPRRPIRPLPPPPGSFEQTVARARSRRRRALVGATSAGLAAVAVIAIAGASSLAHVGAQHDVRPAVPVVSSPPPSASPAPAPSSASPSTTAPVVVAPPVSPPVVLSSPPPSAPVSVAPAMYHGRLTDAAHHPLKGYRVYWEKHLVGANGESNTIGVDHPAAITRADGTFTTACPAAGTSLVIPPKPLTHDAQALVYNKAAEELSMMQVGDLMVARMIDPSAGCRPGAATTTTVFRLHAVVTGTVSIDGKPYSAADAARQATAQPGEPGSDLTLFVEIPSPSGEVQMDGMLPVPGTGAFTLDGLGTGDVVFLIASTTVKVPVTDGQSVKVAISITMGSSPTGGDATATVTVVP